MYVLGRRIHMKSDDRDIPMDEVKARLHVAGLVNDKRGFVLVDEVDGMVTGMLVGFSDELWYSRRRYAVPLLVYAERVGAMPWMVRRFLKWAFEQRDATQVPLDCSFGGPLGKRTVEIFRREIRSHTMQKHGYWMEEVGASFIVRRAA